MSRIFCKRIAHSIFLVVLASFFAEIPAASSSGNYDYSHRKRECRIKVISDDGVPIPYMRMGIGQISSDFEFGGTIRGDAFDTLIEGYEETFQNYFDVAIPENELRWEQMMKCSQKCAPVFSKTDTILAWMLERKMPVYGRSLFSNEKETYIPEWTRTLSTAAFKQAMLDRIDTVMSHCKGTVAAWEIIDAVCHGENGSLLSSGMLGTKSGDTAVFKWILEEARKRDTVAEFGISDYGLITATDSTAAAQFIDKVKPLKSLFDFVAADGHFGVNLNKSSYESNINYCATKLGKKVWLNNIDFSCDTSLAKVKLEELMRTCFANPNVRGISMGNWYQRHMSASNLTSYFVDSLNHETPLGELWRTVRKEWKTDNLFGVADDSGTFTFSGFLGRYQVNFPAEVDSFYLEPGAGTHIVEIKFNDVAARKRSSRTLKTIEFTINGVSAFVKVPAPFNKPLFLSTYSLSGQQLTRSSVSPSGGKHRVQAPSSCSRVFRIETADQKALYTGKLTTVR